MESRLRRRRMSAPESSEMKKAAQEALGDDMGRDDVKLLKDLGLAVAPAAFPPLKAAEAFAEAKPPPKKKAKAQPKAVARARRSSTQNLDVSDAARRILEARQSYAADFRRQASEWKGERAPPEAAPTRVTPPSRLRRFSAPSNLEMASAAEAALAERDDEPAAAPPADDAAVKPADVRDQLEAILYREGRAPTRPRGAPTRPPRNTYEARRPGPVDYWPPTDADGVPLTQPQSCPARVLDDGDEDALTLLAVPRSCPNRSFFASLLEKQEPEPDREASAICGALQLRAGLGAPPPPPSPAAMKSDEAPAPAKPPASFLRARPASPDRGSLGSIVSRFEDEDRPTFGILPGQAAGPCPFDRDSGFGDGRGTEDSIATRATEPPDDAPLLLSDSDDEGDGDGRGQFADLDALRPRARAYRDAVESTLRGAVTVSDRKKQKVEARVDLGDLYVEAVGQSTAARYDDDDDDDDEVEMYVEDDGAVATCRSADVVDALVGAR